MLSFSDEYVSEQNYASYPVSEVGDEYFHSTAAAKVVSLSF
jgi:hypothetical protein